MMRVSQIRAPIFLQEDVGRDFEQRVADEEQAGAKAVGRGTDAQVVLHMGAHEADVHAVDVVDDKHDDEQRQDVALDLGDGRQQHRIRSGIRLEAGCVHWFSPTRYFFMRGIVQVPMLIDIIQPDFFE
nr:hypothetical protein GCM10020185_02690 [Pseudomonas brassicacearum subsp. brassicacearum]